MASTIPGSGGGGLEDLVGDTPLVRIPCLSARTGHTVLAKCEWLNPTGSPKDRIARAMIRGAEAEGLLVPWAAKVRGTPDVVIEGGCCCCCYTGVGSFGGRREGSKTFSAGSSSPPTTPHNQSSPHRHGGEHGHLPGRPVQCPRLPMHHLHAG